MPSLLTPDDFAGRPYEGGLNQMGHVILGAAIVGVLSLWLAPHYALMAAGMGIVTFEGWQLHRMGATLADYWIDLCYWLTGAAAWSWVVSHNPDMTLAPVLPCLAFVLEYVRIRMAE